MQRQSTALKCGVVESCPSRHVLVDYEVPGHAFQFCLVLTKLTSVLGSYHPREDGT